MIQIVHRDKISVTQWNQLLQEYHYPSPYIEIFYLDAVCANWSALVFDDYKAVLPFCWNKKWGVRYIYQPPFLQQMMYVGPTLDVEIQEKVRLILYAFADFIDLKLNLPLSGVSRNNFELDLNKEYAALERQFNSQTKKNLKNKSVEIHQEEDIDQFLKFYQQHTIPKIEDWKTDFTKVQKALLLKLEEHQKLKIVSAKNKDNIVTQIAFVVSENRIIQLMNSTSEEGRKLQGNSHILNFFIQQYAGKPYILDFEGSQIEPIAHFNKGFGAINNPYYHLMSNRLRFPFNLFKRA